MKEINEYLGKIESLSQEFHDFKTEAYHFTLSGLNFTMSRFKEHRHLSGGELSLGLKDYALDQFGPLAKTVLDFWGLKETLDFGKIVYRLIDVQLMSKTDEDSIEDFRDVFEFEKAFGKEYNFLEHEDV